MTNPSALITGASRGIGLGIATRLARLGYGLTISARDRDALETVTQQLLAQGAPRVVPVVADLGDPEAAQVLATAHQQEFTTLRALILNAGVGTAGSIAEYPKRRFDKTVAVNFAAPFAILQSALPMLRAAAQLRPDSGAKVVAVTSITGTYAEAGLAAYGATKAALGSLIETLNLEESRNGVTGSNIAPAYVDTAMSDWIKDRIPAEAMLEINDIVELVDAVLRLSARAVLPKIVLSRAGASLYEA